MGSRVEQADTHDVSIYEIVTHPEFARGLAEVAPGFRSMPTMMTGTTSAGGASGSSRPLHAVAYQRSLESESAQARGSAILAKAIDMKKRR